MYCFFVDHIGSTEPSSEEQALLVVHLEMKTDLY